MEMKATAPNLIRANHPEEPEPPTAAVKSGIPLAYQNYLTRHPATDPHQEGAIPTAA